QRSQVDFSVAQEARLDAERDGLKELVFPEELTSRRAEPNVAHAISDQAKQFNERRASIVGQIDLLETKIRQHQSEIDGLALEEKSTNQQLGFINDELTDLRGLLKKQLVQKSRVLQLEREKARLEGIVGRSMADQAKAKNAIGEANLQIRQIRQKFL